MAEFKWLLCYWDAGESLGHSRRGLNPFDYGPAWTELVGTGMEWIMLLSCPYCSTQASLYLQVRRAPSYSLLPEPREIP